MSLCVTKKGAKPVSGISVSKSIFADFRYVSDKVFLKPIVSDKNLFLCLAFVFCLLQVSGFFFLFH